MHDETAKVKFENDVDGTDDLPIGVAEKAVSVHAAWAAGEKRKAGAAASAQAAPRASAAAAAAGTALRASGAAAGSPDEHADGDGPLAGMKDMTRDQWAEVNGKLNDDELRDSVHASMQLCEVRSCDVLNGRHAPR